MVDNKNVDISIIIPCKNESGNLKWTIDSIYQSKNNLSYEIIVVDNVSTDNGTDFLKTDINYKNVKLIKIHGQGLSTAMSRNKGVEMAEGKILLFCDSHVKVEDRWLDNLVDAMEKYNADAVQPCVLNLQNTRIESYGLTWDNNLQVIFLRNKPREPVEIPIIYGCTFGITKEAFDKIGGFDNLYKGWGVDDQDLSIKVWMYGYKIIVDPSVRIRHLIKNHPASEVAACIIYNTLVMAFSHFTKERIIKVINLFRTNPYYGKVCEEIKQNKELIVAQRNKFFSERKYNDDYFFNKFNIFY